MNDCDGQYEALCKGEFGKIHGKLDQLDEAIRGNGKPGIQTRLDRLEWITAMKSRFIWLIIGVAATLAGTGLWNAIFKR